jgi:hypothetical protein
MGSGVTKSNAYNWGGLAPQSAFGTPAAAPARLSIYKDFKGNAKKNFEEDEGHSGARNMTQGIDITGMSAEPEIGGLLKPDEILGDVLRGFFGKVTTARWLTSAAYKHDFEESDDGDLFPYSIFQGYNVGSSEVQKPKRFADQVISKLDFKFSTKETPSFTANHAGDFPTFGITEPSLVYPTPRIPPFLAPKLRVYLDDIGGTIGTTLLDGFMEGDVSLDNQVELDAEHGGDAWETAKDMGGLKSEGGLKRRHTDTDLQREWATGAADGENPTLDNEEGMLRFEVTGGMIKEAAGTATIYPYIFMLDIMHAVFTENDPSESGDGARTYDIKWQALPDETGDTAKAFLQNKIVTYAAV